MLVNYAFIKRTVVYNVAIVDNEDLEAVQMIVDMGGIELPQGSIVSNGDIYEKKQFYREDSDRGLVKIEEWSIWERNKDFAISIIEGYFSFSGLKEEDKENVKAVLEYFVSINKITQEQFDKLIAK